MFWLSYYFVVYGPQTFLKHMVDLHPHSPTCWALMHHCQLSTGSEGLTWCLIYKHAVWHKSNRIWPGFLKSSLKIKTTFQDYAKRAKSFPAVWKTCMKKLLNLKRHKILQKLHQLFVRSNHNFFRNKDIHHLSIFTDNTICFTVYHLHNLSWGHKAKKGA